MPKWSKKQRGTLLRAIAYCSLDYRPSPTAVADFFAWIDTGQEVPLSEMARRASVAPLVLGHNLASGMQRTIWADGLVDIGIGDLLIGYLRDASAHPRPRWAWRRKSKAYEDLYKLAFNHIHSAQHPISVRR